MNNTELLTTIDDFITYRKCSESWNEGNYGLNMKLFKNYCLTNFPNDKYLTQEMIDTWCAKRKTESNCSHNYRIQVIYNFVMYVKSRNIANLNPPPKLKPSPKLYVPHSFSDEELKRFFYECDNIVPFGTKPVYIIRKITLPVFFRLLYSSGMRTTEARFLKVTDIDYNSGIVNIQKSKGYDQHYVVLHKSMLDVLQQYEKAISKIQPNRVYLFESIYKDHYKKDWVTDNFNKLWVKANGNNPKVTAYDLRHNYATTNINSWLDGGFEFYDKFLYLSKSMGHRSVKATQKYYSIVPELADTLIAKTESGFNAIIAGGDFNEE